MLRTSLGLGAGPTPRYHARRVVSVRHGADVIEGTMNGSFKSAVIGVAIFGAEMNSSVVLSEVSASRHEPWPLDHFVGTGVFATSAAGN